MMHSMIVWHTLIYFHFSNFYLENFPCVNTHILSASYIYFSSQHPEFSHPNDCSSSLSYFHYYFKGIQTLGSFFVACALLLVSFILFSSAHRTQFSIPPSFVSNTFFLNTIHVLGLLTSINSSMFFRFRPSVKVTDCVKLFWTDLLGSNLTRC